MTEPAEPGTPALEFIFHPRAIAIAGVSSRETGRFGGGNFVRSLLNIGFPGPIYLIHPTASSIRGLTCYRSLRDVPGEVDYVISSVTAGNVAALVEDCIAAGTVRLLHLFTAGFTESGDASQAELEQQVVARAREGGIRVIGPNCMGVYSPESRMAFYAEQPAEVGSVGLISQSGHVAQEFMRYAVPRGLRASKIVSFGNGTDLKAADFLDYFAEDRKTEIITAYIEGVQDGPRLAASLRAAARVKPTIVLKGGRTEEGRRAAASHTASLAGSLAIFDGLCRQAGAIRVEDVDELVDMAAIFSYTGHIAGPRLAVVGAGGGASVLAADAVGAAGLSLAEFQPETLEALAKVTQAAGTSIRNPVDSMNIGTAEGFEATMIPCAMDPSVDLVLYHTAFGGFGIGRPEFEQRVLMQREAEILAEVREKSGKPVVVAIRPATVPAAHAQGLEFQDLCARAGIASDTGVSHAATAIVRRLDWQRRRAQE